MNDLERNLAAYLTMLHIDVSAGKTQSKIKKLLQYVDLLEKWNRVYNLTAIRAPVDILSHHLLDSLAVLPYLAGDRIADVGSGAGLPGIPIAVFQPNWQIVLIESSQKKAVFLHQVKIELKLDNVTVISQRAEEFYPDDKFNFVISRAFSNLRDFALLAGHLLNACSTENKLLAMKGINPTDEIKHLPENFFVERIIPLSVPGLDKKRHLVVIKTKSVNKSMACN